MISNIKTIEVAQKDKESIRLFEKFYNEIFLKAFTNENETTPLDDVLQYLNSNNNVNLPNHIFIYMQDNEILGGIIVDYFKEIDALAIEFIVVNEQFRNQGLANYFINNAIETLYTKYNIKFEWIFIEIERPEVKNKEDMAYMSFWQKNGFKMIDFDYQQPALGYNKQPVNMLLCVKNTINKDIDKIPSELVKLFISDYAKYSMQIEHPQIDQTIMKMEEQLNKSSYQDLYILLDKYKEVFDNRIR